MRSNYLEIVVFFAQKRVKIDFFSIIISWKNVKYQISLIFMTNYDWKCVKEVPIDLRMQYGAGKGK